MQTLNKYPCIHPVIIYKYQIYLSRANFQLNFNEIIIEGLIFSRLKKLKT